MRRDAFAVEVESDRLESRNQRHARERRLIAPLQAKAAQAVAVPGDAADPAVYRQLAWTRYRGRVLLQLVYTLWFPERPPASANDMPRREARRRPMDDLPAPIMPTMTTVRPASRRAAMK